tara:strand:- start:1090 stop:1302 length:213 start_codon:yes stop_codon:yes gene_type:complete
MDNIINFPTWIIEKERELSKLEFEIGLEILKIEKEKSRIRHEKANTLFKNMICFFSGIGVGGVIVILSIM